MRRHWQAAFILSTGSVPYRANPGGKRRNGEIIRPWRRQFVAFLQARIACTAYGWPCDPKGSKQRCNEFSTSKGRLRKAGPPFFFRHFPPFKGALKNRPASLCANSE